MRGRGWLVVACLALAGVMFLAVFPLKTWLAQREHEATVAERVRSLSAENDRLEERARQLQTPAEIERLAREQYGLVRPGEEVYAVLGSPAAPPPPPEPPMPPIHRKAWWEQVLDVVTAPF